MDRSQGRTGGIVSSGATASATFTGNRALQIETSRSHPRSRIG
jgi:hypothetical protein